MDAGVDRMDVLQFESIRLHGQTLLKIAMREKEKAIARAIGRTIAWMRHADRRS